jgi:kumamolisin
VRNGSRGTTPSRRWLARSTLVVLPVTMAFLLPVVGVNPATADGLAQTPHSADRTRSIGDLGRRLGPTRVPRVTFLAQLQSDAYPTCLESWAQSAELVVHWSPGESWVSITGSPKAVDRGFDVSIDAYRDGSGRVAWAANRPASLPASACGEISGIGDIRSFVRPTTYGRVKLGASSPGLSPAQLMRAYDATPLASRGVGGQGETVVLFEVDAYSSSDVTAFARAIHHPLKLVVPLGTPNSVGVENTMDIETVHEIAPAAKLVDLNILAPLFSGTSEAALFEEAFDLASENWPGAIWSLSLGLCEDDPTIFDSTDLSIMNETVAAAELAGTTVFAASGDAGGLECMPPDDAGQPPLASWEGVSVPASLPNVTAVGGTSLSTTTAGQYLGETTWTWPLLSQGSGGGLSRVFTRPLWQTGPGTGGVLDPSAMRQVPDVSADADPATGNDIILSGGVTTGGGTSLASPIWAGFTALIDQYLRSHGGKAVGFFNTELYQLAETSPRYRPLHDITQGGNDFYPATRGYDMVTGLGSPNVWNLARDLAISGD